jgi:hypothetical protein
MTLRCANVTSSIVLTIVNVAFWCHLHHSEFATRNLGFVALRKVPNDSTEQMGGVVLPHVMCHSWDLCKPDKSRVVTYKMEE